VFLCLPGLFRLGISLFVGPSLSPTRRMPGLDCVFRSCQFESQLLFLEDYEGGGWEERTRDPELEWRRI